MISIEIRLDANTITRGHAEWIEKAVLAVCDETYGHMRADDSEGLETIQVTRIYSYDLQGLGDYAFRVIIKPDTSGLRPSSDMAPKPRDFGNRISETIGPFVELHQALFDVRIIDSYERTGSFQPSRASNGDVEWSI